MRKKDSDIAIWIFSSLTVIALIHLVDAALAFISTTHYNFSNSTSSQTSSYR